MCAGGHDGDGHDHSAHYAAISANTNYTTYGFNPANERFNTFRRHYLQ